MSSCKGAQTLALTIALMIVVLTVHSFVHYLYGQYCAPFTFWGVFSNVFTAASPACDLLLTMSAHTAKSYLAAWGLLGTAVLGLIAKLAPELLGCFASSLWKYCLRVSETARGADENADDVLTMPDDDDDDDDGDDDDNDDDGNTASDNDDDVY